MLGVRGVSRAGPSSVLAHKWVNVSVREGLGSWIYGSEAQRKGLHWRHKFGDHWFIGGKATEVDESPKEKMHGDRGLAKC